LSSVRDKILHSKSGTIILGESSNEERVSCLKYLLLRTINNL
jgi:hypothetical protein